MIFPDLCYYILLAVIGLCFGSFVTALVHRIPRDIPWIYDSASTTNKASRSQCPSCGATLTVFDLVPLFSWLFSKGRCRHCGDKISIRYPVIELVTMLAVLAQFHAWGPVPAAIPVLLAVPFMIAGLLIDWDHMILPDDTNIALALLSFVFLAIVTGGAGWDFSVAMDHLVAAILLTGLFWIVSLVLSKLKGRDALGHGDLKFLPAAGLFLGTAAIPTFLALSGVLGLITAIFTRNRAKNNAFPFGPALILSLYLHVFLTGLGFDYTW